MYFTQGILSIWYILLYRTIKAIIKEKNQTEFLKSDHLQSSPNFRFSFTIACLCNYIILNNYYVEYPTALKWKPLSLTHWMEM